MQRVTRDVTIGTQVGQIEVDNQHQVRVHLTDLRGTMTLIELEGLLRHARDLDKRLNGETMRKPIRRRR